MLETVIIVFLMIASFIAGIKLDDYYHSRATRETKDALERQFIRLQTHSDADDPCRPYIRPLVPLDSGDYDGDGPLGTNFMQSLKETGKASVKFRKSDLAK